MTAPPDNPNRIDLAGGAWIAPDDAVVTFARSSGPGGQSVNKVSTQAQLRVRVPAIRGLDDAARGRLRRLAGRRLTGDDEILIQASTSRSAVSNRRACLERLRSMVGEAARRPKRRKPTRPSRSSIERRLSSKRQRSEAKRRRRRVDDD